MAEERWLATAEPVLQVPVISDSTLVLALTQAEQGQLAGQGDLPFGARLPLPAQLVAEALHQPPPSELHLQFQRHIGQALGALAVAAGAVAASASALSPHNTFNAFSQLSAVSSEAGAVSGSAFSGARAAVYRLRVLCLATAQENVGALLAGEAPAGLQPGRHTFEARTAAGGKVLHLHLTTGESCESVLLGMASAVNRAGLALLATLQRPTAGTVQAVIVATDSGSASGFSLRDVEGALVRFSGADQVSRPPRDAAYMLNGVRILAPSNHILLQAGKVQLTLHASSAGSEQTVSVGPDREALLAGIHRMAEAVSGLAVVITNDERCFAPGFVAGFRSVLTGLESQLRQTGVELQPDGGLKVDRAALAYALEQEPELVESVFASANGAAQRIGAFAADLMSAPISRFGAREFIPAALPATSHPSPQMLLASNSLSALLYTQLLAHGLFINSLF